MMTPVTADECCDQLWGALEQVLRLEASGRSRQVYARRRDLLKEHRLQPRDLRRIDLSVDVNKAPPSITVKDSVILLCLGGVRYKCEIYFVFDKEVVM
jgi:hypothetical protein